MRSEDLAEDAASRVEQAGQGERAHHLQGQQRQSAQRVLPGLIVLVRHHGQHEDQRQSRAGEPAQVAPKPGHRACRPEKVGCHQPVRPGRLTQDLERQVDQRRNRES